MALYKYFFDFFIIRKNSFEQIFGLKANEIHLIIPCTKKYSLYEMSVKGIMVVVCNVLKMSCAS